MDPKDSRYVVGTQPINRRTANRVLPKVSDEPVRDERETERRALQLRQRLAGTHTLRNLAARPAAARQAPLRARTLGLTLVGVACLALGLIGSWGSVLPAVAAGLCFVGAWWGTRAAVLDVDPSALGHGLALEEMAALDALLLRAQPELQAPVAEQLHTVQADLAQVLNLPGLGAEDSAYLAQCVRRYLPDSIETYLRLPPVDREKALAGSTLSAHQALQEQLGLIQTELRRLQTRASTEAEEALLRQHRFLQAKSRRH